MTGDRDTGDRRLADERSADERSSDERSGDERSGDGLPACDRVVIIGASNVTLGLPLIWQGVRRHVQQPTDLLVAAGHGRSFGMSNTVLGRTLPSILDCGLWSRLEQSNCSSTACAVITDVGNDIMYGADPDRIADWVRECVERLQKLDIRICLTGLPMDSVGHLTRGRFEMFRRLLFPNSKLSWEEVLSHAESLNASLRRIAEESQLAHRVPESHWYGFDPIHIRRKHRLAAWHEFLGAVSETLAPARSGFVQSVRIWQSKAEISYRSATLRREPQPVREQSDVRLWLY